MAGPDAPLSPTGGGASGGSGGERVEIDKVHALLEATAAAAAKSDTDVAAVAAISQDVLTSSTPGTFADKVEGNAFRERVQAARQIVNTARASLLQLAESRAAVTSDLETFLEQYKSASNGCKRKVIECKASLEVAKKIKKEIGMHIENIPEVEDTNDDGSAAGVEALPESSDLFGDDADLLGDD